MIRATLVVALALAGAARGEAPLDDGKDHSDELVPEVVEALSAARNEDTAAFDRRMEGWKLPEAQAWFARVYGDGMSKKLADQYAAAFRLTAAIYHDVASGAAGKVEKADIEVRRIVDPADRDLSPGQSDMLFAMDPRVPLHLVFLRKGDKRVAVEAFIRVDGEFRLFPVLMALQGFPRSCTTNLGQIRIYCLVYETAHGEYPPSLEDMRGPTMAEKEEELHCPADATGRSGYTYFYPVRGKDTPEDDLLAWDTKPHADGKRTVLRFGGKREPMAEDELNKLIEKQSKDVAGLIGPALKAARDAVEKATGDEKARLERKIKSLEALEISEASEKRRGK